MSELLSEYGVISNVDDRNFTENLRLERDDEDFDVTCALIVNADFDTPVVDSLKKRLRAPVSAGGCQLLVKVVRKPSIGKKGSSKTALLVGCDDERLLKEAELSGLMKVGPHGDMVPFTWDHHVKHEDAREQSCEKVVKMFSQSEKLRLLCQMVDRLRISTEDIDVTDDIPLIYVAAPHLRSQGIVADVFPLHDYDTLNRLSKSWYRSWSYEQPFDGIRDYFGEKIAIYFAFLSFYTKALIICAAIAIIYSFAFVNSAHAQAIFASINLLILTLFLKFWRRRCATIAYYWGTLGFYRYESPRPEFKGKMEPSPVTHLPEPVYPSRLRWRTIILISYPIVLIWLGVAVFVIWLYFWVLFRVERVYNDYQFVVAQIVWNTPTIIYSIVIEVLNRLFKRTAVFLTNKENHRLQSEYEYHLMVKLILFQFINNFGWLFYVAFIQVDMVGLRRYLILLLITYQVLQQIQECLWPLLMMKFMKCTAKPNNLTTDAKRVFDEESLGTYEDTFNDYLELWLQFGYAFMFSAVYPMAAFWALLNNISEMRCDAFKICRTVRRPFPQAADDIGPWQIAFDALVAVAVATNCALLGMSESFQKYFSHWDPVHRVVLVVFIEHAILVIIVAIHKVFLNVPEKIRLRLARVDYSAMQALIRRRAEHICKRPPSSCKRWSSYSDDMPDRDSYRAATAGAVNRHRATEV